MANANGHLQVINVIHGCQLTLHPNTHRLWNTNQTVSPWCTDYFIPLIWGFILKIRTTKTMKRHLCGFFAAQKSPHEHRDTHPACSLQTDTCGSLLDNEQLIFLPLWQVYFWHSNMMPTASTGECHVGDPMLHWNSPRYICVVRAHLFLYIYFFHSIHFVISQQKLSNAALQLNDIPECHLADVLSLAEITPGLWYLWMWTDILLHTNAFGFGIWTLMETAVSPAVYMLYTSLYILHLKSLSPNRTDLCF